MKRLVIRVLVYLGMAGVAAAATVYWDNNGATAGFGTAGGTWGVDALWSGDAAGLSVPTGVYTTVGDNLVFGTDRHGLATGTINVAGAQQGFSARCGLAPCRAT